MFGFIKNIIAGILSFLTGLFGGKKSNGYYLELKEDNTEVKKPAPKSSNGTKPAPAAPAPAAKQESPKPVATTANGKNGKSAPAPAPEPEKVPVAKATTPAGLTFAPQYLTPASSNGRRRPGANMRSFLDMASQVKTPN